MVAATAGAAAQAVTGFGFSLVAAPVFVFVVGPMKAVRLTNLLAIVVNLIMLARERKSTNIGFSLGFLVPAIVVTPAVAFAIHRTSPAILSVLVGISVITCAVALISGRRATWIHGRPGLFMAGAVSATTNTASGVGGPAVAMYAVNAGWTLEMTRPTLALFFVGLNVVSLAVLGLITMPWWLAGGLVACACAGFAAGMVFLRRLSPTTLSRATLFFALAGGVAAIVRGLLVL